MVARFAVLAFAACVSFDACADALQVLTVSQAADRVRALEGKPVVMVLYSTTCPISRRLMPQLGPLAAKSSRDIQWEVYSTDDPRNFGDVQAFLARNGAPFTPVAIEPWKAGDLIRAMGPLGIRIGSTWTRPLVAVRNSAGRIIAQEEAVDDIAGLRRAIAALR